MISTNFDIKILELYWLEGIDPREDLCAHGTVRIQMGDKILADQEAFTLSAAALYLMRTLSNNYQAGEYENQLFPCCGHTMIANPDQETVSIFGCPSGLDWDITHLDQDKIKHSLKKGPELVIAKEAYVKIVLGFADQVEDFYKNSLPKILPDQEWERAGYLSFWREWQTLRGAWPQG